MNTSETTPCPDCDEPGGKQPEGDEISCMTDGCEVGDYREDGTVIFRG